MRLFTPFSIREIVVFVTPNFSPNFSSVKPSSLRIALIRSPCVNGYSPLFHS
nr:MAG TPA: hypothetical protein [Caudoviricetes sp.]